MDGRGRSSESAFAFDIRSASELAGFQLLITVKLVDSVGHIVK
jgi:hypothetical protein